MSAFSSFGKVIAHGRKRKDINQKRLAELVTREDGQPISPQYLNDIEHDRRTPSTEVIKRLAEVLDLDVDYLHYLAKRWPDDLADAALEPEQVRNLMVAFRMSLRKD